MNGKKEKFGVRELARRLNISTTVIYNWVKKGIIKPEGYRPWGFGDNKAMWFTVKTLKYIEKNLKPRCWKYKRT